MVCKDGRQEPLAITRVWQKWRFSASQTHLWCIKVWFSASTFVVKIATFAKPETVIRNLKKTIVDKIDWTYITALISITFGWFLNELGQWFRTRQDDKKIKRKILYNLLETNFIFNQLDTSNIVELLTERILLRVPKHEQTDEVKQYLNKLYSGLIDGLLQDNVADNLKSIEEKYTNAVDSLATIDPVTAYRLNGKTKIIETFDLLEDYYEEVKQQFPNDAYEMQGAIELATSSIKPEIIKEAIEDLENEIRDIAFSIDIRTWYKVKQTLKSSKDRIRKDGVKKIDELLDKLIPRNQ
jgi:hypothetical protein